MNLENKIVEDLIDNMKKDYATRLISNMIENMNDIEYEDIY